MKLTRLNFFRFCLPILLSLAVTARGQNEITIEQQITPGLTPPTPVALEGFTGEVLEALKFDLYVQGYSFVAPDAAQYIRGA